MNLNKLTDGEVIELAKKLLKIIATNNSNGYHATNHIYIDELFELLKYKRA